MASSKSAQFNTHSWVTQVLKQAAGALDYMHINSSFVHNLSKFDNRKKASFSQH